MAGIPARAAESVATAFAIDGNLERTKFMVDVSQEVGYTVSVLPDPFRVIIDLPEVSFDVPPGAGRKAKGLVKSVRYGVIDEGKSRIVIDTQGPILIEKSYLQPAKGKKPARIVVELVTIAENVFFAAYAKDNPGYVVKKPAPAVDSVASITPPAPASAPIEKPIASAPSPSIVAKPARADGRKVIVIDPGHGGIDPGAVSRRKTLEKDVVLAFSKVLKTELASTGRYHVVLTRDHDRFMSLKDRVNVARAEGADLFIAVHADTYRGQSVSGTTLYTLSDKASDAEAEAFAQKENRSDIIAGIDLEQQNEYVADILIDLVQRESKNHAIVFSRKAVAELKQVTRMTGKPIRSAGFVVLKAPDVPSVLIELGYLSSQADEERLKSDAWRKRMAKAMALAVDQFFATQQVAAKP